MNPLLLDEKVQQFLQEHRALSPQDMALRKSPFSGVSASELAAQLDARQRSRWKLPAWYATEGIYYPKRLSIEQSSSAATATYKASLIPEGSRLLDMTGGFGVDSFTFAAERDCRVTYCERDEELAAAVQHNAGIMNVRGLDFYVGDGHDRLRSAQLGEFDVIYLDPARRKGSQKVFRLEDSEPAIPDLLPELFAASHYVLLKLAPMLDIQEAIRTLPQLREIHVVSVDGECKELLCVLKPGGSPIASPKIVAVSIKHREDPQEAGPGPHKQSLQFTLEEEQNSVALQGPPLTYIYEPDAALLKAGAFKWISQHFALHKIHMHTHLYTSKQLIPGFMGRITRVEEVLPYSTFKKIKPPLPANVITRNFPLKPAELRKRHRIGENPNSYLYFCTGPEEQLLAIRTSRLAIQSTDAS